MTLISIAPRTWTRSEHQRLGELGVFEDDRVELFRGQIVQMSPQDPLQSGAVENLSSLLFAVLGGRKTIRIQLPFHAPDNSEPEPAAAVLDPDVRGFHLYYEGLELLIHAGLAAGSVQQVDSPQAGDLALYDLSGFAFDKEANRLRSNAQSCSHAAVVQSTSPVVDRSKYGIAGPVVITGGQGAFGGTPIYFRINR